ncbi:Spx/MgsR family RNA polymerase-binding regulatory protein [Ornithinibacillus gellani]|uniref:transcriptional regulator Spx n=1 Tax=Ornithinibacillus gellani TaxID=2293253 RepID=UPI000F473005|nr:transcriptional regulator Spx [Ornithinibacillus gellani]TQS74183.1 Spx/MgsR family RNA polymerase-binding regulatory protein [Ornithinibacillus gellani]
MDVTIFGIPCGSTRKAREWLMKNGITYEERNIKKDPITIEELQMILGLTVDGTDEIISKRSKVFKDLDLDLDTLSLLELLNLIQKHPGLLRSPIIIDDKRIQVGYNEYDIRQFLPRKTRERQWLQWRMKYLRLAEN